MSYNNLFFYSNDLYLRFSVKQKSKDIW